MEAEAPLLVAVTSLPGAAGGAATAAAVGVAVARIDGREPLGVVVVDTESGSRPRPTLVSSTAARSLESRLRMDLPAVARGAICAVTATKESLPDAIDICRESGAATVVVHGEPALWRELVDTGEVGAAVLRADTKASRPLTALAARDLISAGTPTCVMPRPPGLVATRRALAGIESGGELGLRSARFARRFVRAQDGQAVAAHAVSRLGDGGRGDASRDPGLGRYGRVALPARGRPCGGVGGALDCVTITTGSSFRRRCPAAFPTRRI